MTGMANNINTLITSTEPKERAETLKNSDMASNPAIKSVGMAIINAMRR